MKKIATMLMAMGCYLLCFSIPKYAEGGLTLRGIELLQDNEDANAYYYIPRYPRMATNDDGKLEFMFIKYVGKGSSGANGGLFHTLIEFTLPGDELDKLQDTLKQVVNNKAAKIVGPVPLQQVMKDGDKGVASFTVVSSILNNTAGANSFAQNVITSGNAPFLPGSKAAIAAKLSPEGATLLWESLNGNTSDVSVTLNGFFEAYVKAYNASITAEVNTVYDHYSRISNYQEGFTRDQMRKITDEMIQKQVLKVESFDRTASLGVKADEMKALVNLITDKLVELMFDTKTGWSATPTREAAVEADQIKGRQERGWFSQTFGGSENTPYFSDNQFVLKKRTDIRSNSFYLNLTQATTIKVPVYTSGNLTGVYQAMNKSKSASEYFKIVNLDDVAFQKRDISFMLDGAFAESFNDIFNFVTVSFRKKYGDAQNDITSDAMFTRKTIEENSGAIPKVISYPRLGAQSAEDWLQYEYKVSWNLKGSDKVIHYPANEDDWIKATDPGVALIPPVQKQKVSVEINKDIFQDSSRTSTVLVKLMVVLGKKPMVQKSITLRGKDASNIQDVTIFHDPGEPVAYQVTKFTSQGEQRGPIKELKDDLIVITSN
jgi:hypothetical protein